MNDYQAIHAAYLFLARKDQAEKSELISYLTQQGCTSERAIATVENLPTAGEIRQFHTTNHIQVFIPPFMIELANGTVYKKVS